MAATRRWVLGNGSLVTLAAGAAGYGRIDKGAVAMEDGRIIWVGAVADLPPEFDALPRENLDGRLVTPALIDCHTHLVFGGDRAGEFEMRLEGATYAQLARAGGGILSTVAATRAASRETLITGALTRLDTLMREGLGTIEIKSGYGLDLETEARMLECARALADRRNVRVRTSFLGTHALPTEFRDRPDAYIDFVCEQALPAIARAGLADAVDGFCEGIGFSIEQIRAVFERAKTLGLPVKLHAEQLSNLGGAALAASCGALSADHLEYLDEAGVAAMAASGTVAVLLPGAFYTLREQAVPPVAALRRAGVPIALATDCNPGSSPLTSLLLTLNMACTLFRLTPLEALAGVTREGARALGLGQSLGTIEVGKVADLAVWDVAQPAELAYRIGFNPLHRRLVGGQWDPA